MVLVFFVLGAAFLLLFLYPYVLYPGILAVLSRRNRRPVAVSRARSGDGELRLAVAVCAYNEAKSIVAKAENLRDLQRRYRGLEVLIYLDGSTDHTLELLRPYEREFRILVGEERRGKSHGMNTLARTTAADIVVFSDCNVIMDVEGPGRALAYFEDPTVGCVCGRLIYTNEEESETATVSGLYWRLEEWIKSQESATGSTMGADGSLFAVRRGLYPTVPPDIIDDMYVSFSVLCSGFRVVSAPEFLAYERTAVTLAEEMRRKVRIACQAFNCHRLLRGRLRTLGWLDRFKYVSHKLLRWFGIYFLALGGILIAAALILGGWLLAAAALVAAAALLFVAGLVFRLQYLSAASRIASSIAATGYGIILSAMGVRFQVWDPPQTAR